MPDDPRRQRQQQIEEAAYRVLERKGFAGSTVLAIAREAKASNETLYSWYGDKTGLFRALVTRNAQTVGGALQAAIDTHARPMAALAAIGPQLIAMLTHPRAVALNRAAAADPGGPLTQALFEAGRQTIGPLIARLLIAGRDDGDLQFDDPHAALDLYLDLLIGDLQHRRVIGLIQPLDRAACEARSQRAMRHFLALCGTREARPENRT